MTAAILLAILYVCLGLIGLVLVENYETGNEKERDS
jgi:preprotein translocase subunit SecG